MFKAGYYDGGRWENVKVYAVHLREDGNTDFLIYTEGGYRWIDSYWFKPKEE